ncbi:MAG: carbon-nitrogen hydrolase family protein [Candidatus Brocadiales bacterium]
MKKKRLLRVAAVQLSSQDGKRQNIEKALEFIDKAGACGARLVVLPELFNCYSTLGKMVKKAEPVPGPTINTLAQKARRNKLYLLCGSILEAATGGKFFNTSVIVGPRGDILGIYRKVNLFDVDIPGGVRFKESERILPGSEIVTVNVNGLVVGLTICYDLRFPEIFSALNGRGAELILIPSAFAAHTGKDHWEVLLRARAIENQAFVVAPNQFGTHPNRITTYGHSMIVDPWGIVLSQAPDKVCVISSELDIDILKAVRKNMPMKRQKV